jgi:hypothetical protein
MGSLEFGSSTWARTRDTRINSPLLYQLSYRGIENVIIKQLLLYGQLKQAVNYT